MAENGCFDVSIYQAGLPASDQWNEQDQQSGYYTFPQTEVALPLLQSHLGTDQNCQQSVQQWYQESSLVDEPFETLQTCATTYDSQQQSTQQQYSREELYLTGFADVGSCNNQTYSFAVSPVMNGSLSLHSSPTIPSQASPGSIPSTPNISYSRLPVSQFQSLTRFREDDLRLGRPNLDGTWSCTFPTCTSEMRFTRGCDLRKHHKRHFKVERCRYPECQFSQNASFSSKKDRNRHEAGHRPGIPCAHGCGRLFSREDNMRDHMRRVHHRHTNT